MINGKPSILNRPKRKQQSFYRCPQTNKTVERLKNATDPRDVAASTLGCFFCAFAQNKSCAGPVLIDPSEGLSRGKAKGNSIPTIGDGIRNQFDSIESVGRMMNIFRSLSSKEQLCLRAIVEYLKENTVIKLNTIRLLTGKSQQIAEEYLNRLVELTILAPSSEKNSRYYKRV